MSGREGRRLLRRSLKVATVVALVGLGLVAVAVAPTEDLPPFIGRKVRPLTNRRFEATPERLARGRYLVQTACHCFGCHTIKEDQPDVRGGFLPSRDGAGQLAGRLRPYHLVVPNITSDPETGLGRWSDDQIARAIREGIGDDGRVLTSMMPYASFRRLSDEDLASITVYLRAMPPLLNPLPRMRLPLLIRLMDNESPQPITAPIAPPDFADPVERGSYYASIAKCHDCHTPLDWKGARIPGLDFAGGNTFEGAIAAPNITPDPTGISYYDEALFIQVMRTGKVGARELNRVMPWWYFGRMSDGDLQALFAYLRSRAPVKHSVSNTEPRTRCRLCRGKHGLGDHNGVARTHAQ